MTVKNEQTYYVNSAHLNWIVDLCRDKTIHMDLVTNGSSEPIEKLTDPNRFMTWKELTDITSSLTKFFDDVDMRETGRRTWLQVPMKSQASIGRVLFNARDQYLSIYGTAGYCARQFPMTTHVEQITPNKLLINLTMKEGAKNSYPFFTMLAGQMEGLTQALGLRPASVTMKTVDRGAIFTINLPSQGIMSIFRRMKSWWMASRQVTGEFANLRQDHEELLRAHDDALRAKEDAYQAIRENESSYRMIGKGIRAAIWTMTPGLRVNYASPSIPVVLDYAPAEFHNLELSDLLSPTDADMLKRRATAIFHGHEIGPVAIEVTLRQKSGEMLLLECQLLRHESSRGRPVILCVARKIINEHTGNVQTKEDTENYGIIADSAMDGIITFDTSNTISYINPVVSEIFGYTRTELTGRSIREIMPEALGDARLRDLYRTNGEFPASRLTLKGLRKDKSLVPLEVAFTSHRYEDNHLRTCIIRDVSDSTQVEQERQSLESQLQAAQKVDSVGQLSGGIAHDFNNLLVAILGYADLAMKSGDGESTIRYLKEIRKAGKRGTDMTQKLLTFSRRQIIEPRLIEANELIHGVHDMLTRLLPGNIELIFTSEANNLHLLADPTQLEQVLINLAVNARDAMPSGGTLRMTLGHGELDGRPGPYLVLTMTDSGEGMDPQVQKRIFEPFYTTKPEGSGTGLGLAVVFGIVNQHEGYISVDSTLGKGTCFSIYLPLTESTETTGAIESAALPQGGHETILVVEDTEQVRDLAMLILSDAGYQVLEASNGAEALEIFEAKKQAIDLVLMDVVMPKLSGRESAESMRSLLPDARILFMSGYAIDSAQTQFISNHQHLIAKPFVTDDLLRQVRQRLDERIPEKTNPTTAEIHVLKNAG